MRAKDICIGSFLELNATTIRVDGFDASGEDMLLKASTDNRWHPIAEFSPIEITKEWLDKLGFYECLFDDDLPEDEMYIGPFGSKFCLKDGCCYKCVESGWYDSIGTAESVHELQSTFNIL